MRGTILIAQGSRPEGIYVVLEGGFDVMLPGQVNPIGQISTGEVVGGIAFLDPRHMLVSVVANQDTSVLLILRSQIEALLAERPGLAVRFYRAVGMHVAQLYRQEVRALAPEP